MRNQRATHQNDRGHTRLVATLILSGSMLALPASGSGQTADYLDFDQLTSELR